MNVAVLSAWRDAGCPWRSRSKELVEQQWSSYGIPITIGHSDPGPFNRAQAINRAAARGDWDVALIVDLDVLIPLEQAISAIELAKDSDHVVVAFDTLMLIGRTSTARIHDGRPLRPHLDGSPVQGHVSCCIVVSRNLWKIVGGFDERFRGWGAEDRAFHAACTTFTGAGARIDGHAHHLWHPFAPERDRKAPTWQPNVELADRYRIAGAHYDGGFLRRTRRNATDLPPKPNPEAMRQLLAEPGGPLAPLEVTG